MRVLTCILLVVIGFAARPTSAGPLDLAALSVPVEVRGVWIDAGAIPKTQSAVRELVRTYHRANLNVLFPEVIARGYTVYQSRMIDRDPRFRDADDPLPPMIDEAHKLGMEVHPWVWVFRAGYSKDRGSILRAHPDWVELSKDLTDLSETGGLWISPAVPEARDLIANLFAELVRNYDVDGIHLDYIRYESETRSPYGYSPASRGAFKATWGIDPVDIDRLTTDQYLWHKFRERQISTFVQQIALQTRSIRPKAIVSAAVGADPILARLTLMQNWQHWIENKWVDFVTPMAYATNDDYFRSVVSREKQAAGSRAIVAPGIGLFQHKDAGQTLRQIGIARQLLAGGHALFSASYIRAEHIDALKASVYAGPALLPFRNPDAQSRKLGELARTQSDSAVAAYYSALSEELAAYARYRQTPIDYIPPTEPPLNIPESVVPLPEMQASRSAGPVVVDGDLSDEPWQSSVQALLQYTNVGAPAAVETVAQIAYDDSRLYIAVRATEPEAGKVKAEATKRDGPVFYDDSVELFIAPTGIGKHYFQFSVNTLGTQFDAKTQNSNWNADWQAAARSGSGEWTMEIAIPFTAVASATPKPGDAWTMNIARNRTVTGTPEYITWAVPYGSFHTPDRFGRIVFR